MSTSLFHPAVQSWFDAAFDSETPVQAAAWERIRNGGDVLIAAPTGSGKTFAAFLCAINDLVLQSERQPLADAVQVLYISPLKALSNDIERNLRQPLEGIDRWLLTERGQASGIRAMVRSGDTSPGERGKMRRQPPQILVTTPESLYLLLTAASGRRMLGAVSTVIVDEIHAVAGSKRGSHLALSLARLDALTCAPARRIGLSATQNPIQRVANFLTGGRPCDIVDSGHQRQRDLALVLPGSPLSAVMAHEVWEEIYDRLEALIAEHHTTLIFVNTRRLAERLARHLAERLGEDAVTAHHGSLARGHRLEAEQALKEGRLRALVATASLELGIDIGHVDLVCQIGSPGSITAFIQRVGRAGHSVGETPKGRLFPLSRDDLVESVALLRGVERGLLDALQVPQAPLDVLAQQLVAEVSARDWETGALFERVRQAWPYRNLSRERFDAVVDMLAGGYATRRGRRAAFVHHDAVNGRLRPRPAARLTALQNGGAIPDQFDYDVVMQPQGYRVGSLNEDFAFESIPGDIFQLGNTSYRILKIEQGRVLVADAHGQPPNIPFWLGDRPGRSDELSAMVSELREEIDQKLAGEGLAAARESLLRGGVDAVAADELLRYLAAARAALGCLPTRKRIVLERFFDDSGDMHLVLHAPLGSRIMRAWGLALRKRFCRHFNFELQAAALEDSLILSLGETHSFESADVPAYLKAPTVRQVLVQALLDAPMFEARWRWNATIALAVQRMRNGRKLPPQWQRNQAEDLVAVVFPDQLACLENIRGEREIPDHPLVEQTIADCLSDNMDIEGLEAVLREIEAGELKVRCVDLTAPSPLAAEIITARPYAFLDDGDAENRRTRAVRQVPDDLGAAATLSIISVDATRQVQAEIWIQPRNFDELHDGLLQLGFLTRAEFTSGSAGNGATADASHWGTWYRSLAAELRACRAESGGRCWWVATERLGEFLALQPDAALCPDPRTVYPVSAAAPEKALLGMLRSRLAAAGPVRPATLAADFALPLQTIESGLLALQNEGYAMVMGDGDGDAKGAGGKTWCERRLLARIHRYSRERRRQRARPVSPAAYMRFLLRWHGLDQPAAELEGALSLLEGWSAPVASWEQALLAARCAEYAPQRLDEQILSGRITWFRPDLPGRGTQQVIAATPITFVPRRHAAAWRFAGRMPADAAAVAEPGAAASVVLRALQEHGAMFGVDLEQRSGLLETQLEQAIAELVAHGLVTADAFSPLRWLIRPEAEKRRQEKRLRGRHGSRPGGLLGRWSLTSPSAPAPENEAGGDLFPGQAAVAVICAALLRRYGVVFRAVLERESLLPPWRRLLRYLRRMEDRGEVHGGRFVEGFSGEQFALPEAVGLLRNVADQPLRREQRVINATDPLNLGGIITPGVKTPATAANRILLLDGLPAARLRGDELETLGPPGTVDLAEAERRLRVVRAIAYRGGGR